MSKFIPGLELSRQFFKQAVQPILKSDFPKLKYSAGLIGWGSEVLGYDTPLSADHHWGPRVLLFLGESDHRKLRKPISEDLSGKLPLTFLGYSTNFSKPQSNGVRRMIYKKSGKVDHMVDIFTVKTFLVKRLGNDATKKFKNADWLVIPQQRLLEITSGDIFHDGINLAKTRHKLSYYPRDVWLYLLAAQWQKISQEEAFMGRAGHAGDELGSQIIAARIVREMMRLCYLMEKKYIPYSKWFGKGFENLSVAKQLTPIFRNVLLSKNWEGRERHLSKACAIMAKNHNALKITQTLPIKSSKYFSRPYLVIHADNFASKTRKSIKDNTLKKLALIGSVDQFTDSTDLSENLQLVKRLRIAFD